MMKPITELNKVAFVGDYLPRKCGIATFTHDLRQSVAAHLPDTECLVVAVTDPKEDYLYPPEVKFEVNEQNLDDYRRAAQFLRFHNVETICVQHEFGVYGGVEGGHLLTFLREAGLPVVTTFHTILTEPNPNQRRVFEELVRLSQRVVTMSEQGVSILRDTYDVSEDKISLIPHGIPDMPFVDPTFFKDQFGVEGKKVLLTFGLLSPGKGLEYAIEAMPDIIAEHPDAVYIILGATHPNLVRQEGESYRHRLQQLTRDLGVEKNVLFFNRFVEIEELKEFIGACDVYLTPYLNQMQITSGTLAYTYGSGKAVVSTPYWHAEELLADGRGCLVPFRDAKAIATAVNGLFSDEGKLAAMRKHAYLDGRRMVWSRVAQSYADVFRQARIDAGVTPEQVQRKHASLRRGPTEEWWKNFELPKLNLRHLHNMTDSTGLFQHAVFSFPNFDEGYCVDDNARALVLTSMLDNIHAGDAWNESYRHLAQTYAAFLQHAFNVENGRFRNFMSFDRRWLEEAGSDDSHARSLWALGACVGRSHDINLQNWAARLFESALPAVLSMGSPRAWAFALIGLHEYQRRLSGVRAISDARSELAQRLLELYREQASDDWPWFEPILSYCNARLPHALIVSGRGLHDEEMLQVGLSSLDWLMQQQVDERGYFAPIGSEGFYPKGQAKATFDQQPIEANVTISACLEAFLVTKNDKWLYQAWQAFDWFLGTNKLGVPVYDASTGGCRDGLHVDRLNYNQGAESTLAFLLSLAEMKAQENALSAFARPVETDHSPMAELSA
ncbi:glycosyltransferase family 4 protein [Coraliomargarita sp. SDUM461004]|uniref:Glycosyltransferase family 4 protein n=1 Tax=Thalassobacterium sedimentorum TaxID=3041258 RepID=A0ABU1AFI8_9BACT|nr:glycosyltransferase family 4 protein [Coraliomargarita sp. SDUM461004]MDQ8193432.1 glycosyltransferase family 4 protein [Coraliomargarita sp. SDUM461004]